MVIFFGTETSPSSAPSSPTIMRKRVVLPEPFGPTRPIFSPGFNWNEASTNRTCRPYCLLMREKEITEPMILAYRHLQRSNLPTDDRSPTYCALPCRDRRRSEEHTSELQSLRH